MIGTAKKLIYKGFGFTLASEIPLPELLACEQDNQESLVDIEVIRADLTQIWSRTVKNDNKVVVVDQMVMFLVPDTAIFCIQGGNLITVSPVAGSNEDKSRLFILGTCMGVLLMQRRVLPLHGSVIAINGNAYAFVGHSGAGKSTLANVLINKGYPLLSDDVIAVSLSPDNKPFVIPSYPQQKLWQESIERLGMDNNHYQPLFERETKYAVPLTVTSQYYADPLPLMGVFELMKSEHVEIQWEPIQGLDRLHTLYHHTFRNFLIPQLELSEWHFHTSAIIANAIDMIRIRRPIHGFTANQLASLIINHIGRQ